MFLLRRPTDDFVLRTLDAQRDAQLTYEDIGLTRESQCPTGYTPNHARSVIGTGEECFRRAKDAIAGYHMLNLGWLQVVPPGAPIEEGALVATLMRTMGIYALNVARIVYVDDDEPDQRFGFSYGTLAEYPVSGEERFTVALDHATGEVSYELFSFSRPSSLLTRVGWPLVRRAQRRFARDSTAAMIAAASAS